MTVLEESRAIAGLLDKMNHMFLQEVPWDTYQAILDEIDGEGRRFRHTYDQGRLEIMTRSSEHEIPKELFGLFLFVLAEGLDAADEGSARGVGFLLEALEGGMRRGPHHVGVRGLPNNLPSSEHRNRGLVGFAQRDDDIAAAGEISAESGVHLTWEGQPG